MYRRSDVVRFSDGLWSRLTHAAGSEATGKVLSLAHAVRRGLRTQETTMPMLECSSGSHGARKADRDGASLTGDPWSQSAGPEALLLDEAMKQTG